MKKENFELIFKIIVLVQLTVMLIIQIFYIQSKSENANEVGRYKEVVTKATDWNGNEFENSYILDTQTGKIINK